MKKAMFAAATILLLVGPTSFASAECSGRGAKVGMCPPNTCAKDGGEKACDTKNCSAANCSKPGATKNRKPS